MKEIKHALAEFLGKEEKPAALGCEIEVDVSLVSPDGDSVLHGNSSFVSELLFSCCLYHNAV